ncbi:hypothetical protein [Curtobacterium sp. MCBD17_028]|uniref:hypothetical protein n=1 Tax=Curtobacterium sp. MCBD17_028 TaxID=2175670 RepID=UPI000DA9F09C|nr:hypothetical protein [Curtobacterium sp. MCBD17_028]PZE23859.1 hypothetical protein DEI86_13520 [Curtobacterium sp. MCBD17_028]
MTTVDTTITGCEVQGLSSVEAPTRTTSAVTFYNATTTYRVSTHEPVEGISKGDQVTWRSATYNVQGRGMTFYGMLPHTEFDMVLEEG